MPHKKGKMGYNKGGVAQRYGKSQKADLYPKRKGYSDSKDGYEKHEYGYSNSAEHSYDGKAYGERKGWGDKEESEISYSQRGGSAQNSRHFKKRRGYSDHGADNKYEDGGIVRDAKMSALMDLKSRMNEMGGESLNAYKNGGVVKASVVAKDEEGLKKGLKKAAKMMGKYEDGGIVGEANGIVESYEMSDPDERLEDLSREELLELLRNK